MDNVEAAYVLITSEAERRYKNELFSKKKSDLCGKVVEVSLEVDKLLFKFAKKIRDKEREGEKQ